VQGAVGGVVGGAVTHSYAGAAAGGVIGGGRQLEAAEKAMDKGQQDYIVKDAVVGAAASVVTGGNAVQGAVGGVVGGVVTHSYAGAAAGGVINGGGR